VGCAAFRGILGQLVRSASVPEVVYLANHQRTCEVVLGDPLEALILDLLEWIARDPRAYSEVMDAWRTSCPRLPVWEEANGRGFVERRHREGEGSFVAVTRLGREFLAIHRGGSAYTRPVTIIGTYISPYVRKVLVCLDLKGIPYEIDPIVPFFGNEEFTRISPVRRIPVLIDDSVTLPDSSAICEYLEDRYPCPSLLPKEPKDRARARWLEEYADTRMGEVFIWRLFNEVVIKRFVWGGSTDEEIVRRAIEEEIPQVLGYLEGELPSDGYLFGQIGVADVALASFFRNASFARFSIDSERWPNVAAFVARVLDHPSFVKLRPFEEVLMRTPIPSHRDALREVGAPLTASTLGSRSARSGILGI
jgi:glutathione S-transferase